MTTEVNESPNPASGQGSSFDAEQAEKMIEALTVEKSQLQERLVAAEAARDTAQEQCKKLEADLNAARREHALSDILRDHPELELLQDRLKGDSVEEIRADAEALAKALKGVKPKEEKPAEEKPAEGESPAEEEPPAEEAPKEEPKPARRPVPKVRPAHGGDQTRPFDPVAIAARARANR